MKYRPITANKTVVVVNEPIYNGSSYCIS